MREVNNNSNKGWIISLIGIVVTAALIFVGGWVQVNSRISVLEVQVQNDRGAFNSNSSKMDGLIQSVNDIKENLVEMRGELKLKADKRLVN